MSKATDEQREAARLKRAETRRRHDAEDAAQAQTMRSYLSVAKQPKKPKRKRGAKQLEMLKRSDAVPMSEAKPRPRRRRIKDKTLEELRREAFAVTNPKKRVAIQQEIERRTNPLDLTQEEEGERTKPIDLSKEAEEADEKAPPPRKRHERRPPSTPSLLGPKVMRRDEREANLRQSRVIPPTTDFQRSIAHSQEKLSRAMDIRQKKQEAAKEDIAILRARPIANTRVEQEAAESERRRLVERINREEQENKQHIRYLRDAR